MSNRPFVALFPETDTNLPNTAAARRAKRHGRRLVFVLLGALVAFVWPARPGWAGLLTPVGAWRAEALNATASAGPGPGGSAIGASSFILLNEWIPNERGFDFAEVPENSVDLRMSLAVNVPPKDQGGVGIVPLTLQVNLFYSEQDPNDPTRRFIVSLGGGIGAMLGIPVDDTYFAHASTHTISNADTDNHSASTGPLTGVTATAVSTSESSAPGVPVIPTSFEQAWGVFSLTSITIDGILAEMFGTEWSRDSAGNVTTSPGLTSDLPSGPMVPGRTYMASGVLGNEYELAPGDHEIVIDHKLWGFLLTRIDGIRIAEPGTLTLLAVGISVFTFGTRRRPGWRARGFSGAVNSI